MNKARYWNPKPSYNPRMANKGKALEELIKYQNQLYKARKISNIQKISTPWVVVRNGKDIISAYPEEKSTLDFRGTVRGGTSVSFDAKESEVEQGLPLKHIEPHQIEYIRLAIELGEVAFILCYIKPLDNHYIIPGETAVQRWDTWQANKGKRGYNTIPTDEMKKIRRSHNGYVLDYLPVALGEQK